MNKKPLIADIHIHPILKSFNWTKKDGTKNPWEAFNHIQPNTRTGRFAVGATRALSKYTQTNFYKLIEGNVRVVCISLYPFERGFLNMRNLPKLFTTDQAIYEVAAITSGMGIDKVKQLDNHTDYYQEFKDEYAYLKKHEGKSPCGKHSYKVVNNYSEIQEVLKKDNELAVIVTCEGAHAFFDHDMWESGMGKKDLKEKLSKHVQEVKEWENPPFFINLMHHFYNYLGGHGTTMYGVTGSVLNQNRGLEKGLEGLGLRVMKEMLSNKNGKRILIDTKHMSLEARREYYRWLRTHNYISKIDNIPIICSHTGVNGFKTMTGSLARKDTNKKNKNSYFFNWAINLSDEELNIIHESDGLMGIIIDKGKLGGGGFESRVNKAKDNKEKKEMYMQLFWDNLFHAVDAVGSKSAWDMFCLGTDFDGAINHVDFYDDAAKLQNLYKDLYEFLDKKKYKKKLWHGYKPEELLDKVFAQNTLNFMEKYFV